MEHGSCRNSDCTVAETGICLNSYKDLLQCENYVPAQPEITNNVTHSPVAGDAGESEQQESVGSYRLFIGGSELGIRDSISLTQASYAHLIGIIGPTNVGKTCFLSSLYLLATSGALRPEYVFAGSVTLQGFEDRARLVRKWGGVLPDKLAEHTVLQDPRMAALMHLSLREVGSISRKIDLLLTDLPGEWFSDLVLHAHTAKRLHFLKRADGIIFMVDGPLLSSREKRYLEIHNAKLLLQRLSETIDLGNDVPVVLVVSKCDELSEAVFPDASHILVEYGRELGFNMTPILLSAFSRNPQAIKSGTGVIESIKLIINQSARIISPLLEDTAHQSTARRFGQSAHIRLAEYLNG